MMIVTPLNNKTISFTVTNLSAADAQFLTSVIGVFCDPKCDHVAAEIRAGRYLMQYDQDGKMRCRDVVVTRPSAAEVIEFVARFTDDEWQDIIRSVTHYKQIVERSIEDAEKIAHRCLGYLPKKVTLEPVSVG